MTIDSPSTFGKRPNATALSFLLILSFQMWIVTTDAMDIAEEDEEFFLRGTCGKSSVSNVSRMSMEDYDMLMCVDGNSKTPPNLTSSMGEDHGDSFVAWPMKDSSVKAIPLSTETISSPVFDPIEQYNWENDIVWGNSPSQNQGHGESCTVSEVESDTLTSAALDNESMLEIQELETEVGLDENDHNLFLCSLPMSLEPFGTPKPEQGRLFLNQENGYHPQILRLEKHPNLVGSTNSENSETNNKEESHTVHVTCQLKKLSLKNLELMQGSWVDKILWEPHQSVPKPKLILDLQDDHMLFEVFDNKDGIDLRSHAGAMIMTRPIRSFSGEHSDQGSLSVGRFNISNDKYYSNRKASQQSKSHSKKRALHGLKVMHSVPALRLQTMKNKLSNKDVANFHRPKALWFPHDNEVAAKEQGQFSAQGPLKIILKSLGGKGCKLHVDATDTVSYLKSKASKKLDFKSSESVKIFYSGKELEDSKTLAQQNVRPNSVLHLVRTKMHLWANAQRIPGDNKPLRPPGAFKKKSELSVKVGHVFLIEYCEERPLILGNVGMGARLCTYYQKANSSDQTAASLRTGNLSLGTLVTLEPADRSPVLGEIKSGCWQSCLETNMYRAPVFPHKVPTTDYLLVRSSKGKLSLRRIDRIYVAGQQEPHMEVITPHSKSMHTYIANRMIAYVYREFRASEKPGFLPCLRADELSAQFPNLPESFIRKRLKHCADLQRGSKGELLWVMRRNFWIPLEEELRRLVTPEDVCTYESMLAGQHRLKRLGISNFTNTASLALAMNQLPDEAITLAAASHIERELQITPWNLSSNFVACTAQDRDNIERLEITGVGDPSGRGLGFSYVRVAPKAPISSSLVKKKAAAAAAAAARGSSTVTGTDADLRRLSMDAAREVLHKFGVPEEQIEKMTRWHRIAMVRKLSSEQAASGIKVDATTLNKFARGQRMSFLQIQQQTREKCQEIWDRQLQSLSAADIEIESDSEANSDLDSFAGDLENLLDAEECEEGDMGNDGHKRDKVEGVRALGMRRNKTQAQAEEEIEDEAAEAAELCRMLMDDDEAESTKKVKARVGGKEELDNATTVGFVSEHLVPSLKANKASKDAFVSELKEVGRTVSKGNPFVKQSILSMEFKKIKKIPDGIKVGKKLTDKPVREGFVCGACGQLGHMRTNKNCPKYGEESEKQEKHVEIVEHEKALVKQSFSEASSHLQVTPAVKKLIPKVLNKEHVETENAETSGPKVQGKSLPVKFKCGGPDKMSDKSASEIKTLGKQNFATPESAIKVVPKISKIKLSSKLKPEGIQMPSSSIPDQASVEVDKIQRPKKIIIKQPKTLFKTRQIESPMFHEATSSTQKSENTVLISSLRKHLKQGKKSKKNKKTVEQRTWEEEERRRKEELEIDEARQRMMYEEARRKTHEQRQKIVSEIKRHNEARTGDGVNKIMLKKKKKKLPELSEVYLEEQRPSRKDRKISHRDRTAKRRPISDLTRLASDHGQQPKRRRGGEVVLSNILETIVENLKEKYEISYLFLKPVSKKEAPDYPDIITNPMDLSTIREKVRKMDYKSSEEFRHDVWQIAYNAHKYNDGRNPGIPPLADQLLDICDDLLDQHSYALADAEAGIELPDN